MVKFLLIGSALVYVVGLWAYADTRRADYLEKVRAAERQPARGGDGRFSFARECPGRAGCLPDLAGFIERVEMQAAAGRRFAWLSVERVSPPSYRFRNPCENEGDDCRQPHEGDSDARFETVSACNPRILTCN